MYTKHRLEMMVSGLTIVCTIQDLRRISGREFLKIIHCRYMQMAPVDQNGTVVFYVLWIHMRYFPQVWGLYFIVHISQAHLCLYLGLYHTIH